MKVKVSEASGPVLDWMVRYAQNGRPPIDYIPNRDNFSTCWNKGGPIIEREGVGTFKEGARWIANITAPEGFVIEQHGPTPLIAAMRCFCVSKLGEEVEIPAELLK